MSVTLSENQKNSLLRLLADDDPSTLSLVKQQLIDKGGEVVPELEIWLKEAHGSPAERHLVEVLDRLKQGHCHTDFLQFCAQAEQGKEFNLEEGALLLASTEYPSTDMSRYRGMLDEMADEVRLHMKREGSPSEIRAVSHILHEIKRFRGAQDRFFPAENVYLNRVLERRVGVATAISLIYILLGKRLGPEADIRGVALPGHFIVRWGGQFFDPSNHGRFLNVETCKQMVESLGHEFTPEQLKPASSRQILFRLLMNLSRVYEIEEDRVRLARIRKYIQALNIVP